MYGIMAAENSERGMKMQISETLLALRTARGISQEALAEALDVSRQAVSKWETGVSLR